MNTTSNPDVVAAYLASKLGLDPKSKPVYVATGTHRYGRGATTDDLGDHVFAVTITDAKVAQDFPGMEKLALTTFAAMDPFKELVQFESDAANVVHRKDQLEKFRLAGAKIPENFKEWIGFNGDLVESWGSIPKHAAQGINRSEDGVSFQVNIPAEAPDAAQLGAKIKASFEARKENMKKQYEDGAIKYLTKGMSEEQKKIKEADIRRLFQDITIEIEYSEPKKEDNYSSPGRVSVSIASKKQREARIAFKDKVMTPADKEELRKSNPLTEPPAEKDKGEFAISSEHFGKATGRVVLFEPLQPGEKVPTPVKEFPEMAGKEDMKRAFEEALVAFKLANKSMEKEVDDFLGDEAFKTDEWNKPKRQRPEHKTGPQVIRDATDPAKANTMTLMFNMKAEKTQALMEKLAAAGAIDTNSPAVTAASDGPVNVPNIEPCDANGIAINANTINVGNVAKMPAEMKKAMGGSIDTSVSRSA